MATEYVRNGVIWRSSSVNAHELHEVLGLLPDFLSAADDNNAVAQLDTHYGWNKFDGFDYNKDTHVLRYPGDPPMKPIASATLRDELILLYPYAWVAVVQKDGSANIARLD